MNTTPRRRTIYEQLADARRELRRTQRAARWLSESRDYWRERARAAEWPLTQVAKLERERRRNRSTAVSIPGDNPRT